MRSKIIDTRARGKWCRPWRCSKFSRAPGTRGFSFTTPATRTSGKSNNRPNKRRTAKLLTICGSGSAAQNLETSIPQHGHIRMKRPPGPKPHFLIGNIPLARNNPLQTFQGWAREFGGIFYYRALWMRVYFVVDPDLAEAVLVRNYQNLLKDRVLRNSRWFFGDGLLTNEGESWLRQRRLAQPAFHRERIASYAKIMTDYAEEMLASWQDNNNDGETRDVHQEMMQLTLRIVVRALFNVEAEQTGKISQTMNVLMRSTSGARMLLPPQFRYLPTPGMIEFRRAVRQADETVYGI